MELQRTGNGLRVVLALALAALVVASDVYLVVYLIIAGDAPDFLSPEMILLVISALLPALLTVGVCFNVRTMIVRRRQAQALLARDPSIVVEASPQPDSARALAPGASLTLTRRYSLNAVFRSLVAILYLPGLVFLGEALVFVLLPSFGRSPLNPSYNSWLDGPPAPPPTALDWLAATLLLLFAVGTLVHIGWQILRDRVSEVSADDTGITARDGLGRCHIAWREIELCARLLEAPKIAPLGGYAVWGRSRSVGFTIPGVEQETDHEPGAGAWETRYVFNGGYNRYIEDAQRLLATIAARAQTPLLMMRLAPERGNQGSVEKAITSMTETDALVLPLASPLYAPSGATADVALDEGEQVALRAHRWLLPVTSSWLTDLSLGVFMIWAVSWIMRPVSNAWLTILVIAAITTPFLALYIVLFRRQRGQSRLPDVSADETGIMTWGIAKAQPVHIPWQRVAAWVVVLPQRGTTEPFRYIVLGDGLRIGWVEPTFGQYTWQSASNPHGAYRKQTERLHALIAARTGLPLRELRTDTAPVAASAAGQTM